MRRMLFVLGVVAIMSAPAFGQTAATYAARAEFGKDERWIGRCQIAAITTAIAVLAESDQTTDHASRFLLATQVIKEPEFIARKLASVLVASAPVVTTAEGITTTTLTDGQLQALIDTNWTRFANALTPAPASPSVAWHGETTVPTGPLVWSGPTVTAPVLNGGAR